MISANRINPDGSTKRSDIDLTPDQMTNVTVVTYTGPDGKEH